MRNLVRMVSALLFIVLPALMSRAAPSDLTYVRTLHITVVDATPERLAEIMKTIEGIVPVRIVDSEEEADLNANYSEDGEGGGWSADLYRLDCQSLSFSELPSRPENGPCERHVYVRIKLGSLRRTVVHGKTPAEELAFGLRDAILGIEPQPQEPDVKHDPAPQVTMIPEQQPLADELSRASSITRDAPFIESTTP